MFLYVSLANVTTCQAIFESMVCVCVCVSLVKSCFSLQAMPGAVMVLTASDIPANGLNNFFPQHEPEPVSRAQIATPTNGCNSLVSALVQVLAEKLSEYAGQTVSLALADMQEHASCMAQAVVISQQSVGTPLLTIKDAIGANSFYDSPGENDVVKIGDVEG